MPAYTQPRHVLLAATAMLEPIHARRSARRALRVALASFALFAAGLVVAGTSSASSALADAPGARPLQDEPIVVDVVIAGAEGLAAFDATLRFDPAVVAVESVTAGDALPADSTWLDPVPDGEDGVVFGSYRAGPGAAGRDGTLATATFRVLGPGAPAIRLDRAGSGAYDAAGASIVPPARLTLAGAAAPPIYLPYAMR